MVYVTKKRFSTRVSNYSDYPGGSAGIRGILKDPALQKLGGGDRSQMTTGRLVSLTYPNQPFQCDSAGFFFPIKHDME